MWPSTWRATRAGSQLGICRAIAVTIPNANEANARNVRIRRTRKSLSLRMRRRRPCPDAARLRLRRSKRRILFGLRADGHEGRLRRGVDSACLLLGHRDRGAVRDELV